MIPAFQSPVLAVAADAIRELEGGEALTGLCTLFTKCKGSLKDGRRLENISWRLWYRELLAPRSCRCELLTRDSALSTDTLVPQRFRGTHYPRSHSLEGCRSTHVQSTSSSPRTNTPVLDSLGALAYRSPSPSLASIDSLSNAELTPSTSPPPSPHGESQTSHQRNCAGCGALLARPGDYAIDCEDQSGQCRSSHPASCLPILPSPIQRRSHPIGKIICDVLPNHIFPFERPAARSRLSSQSPSRFTSTSTSSAKLSAASSSNSPCTSTSPTIPHHQIHNKYHNPVLTSENDGSADQLDDLTVRNSSLLTPATESTPLPHSSLHIELSPEQLGDSLSISVTPSPEEPLLSPTDATHQVHSQDSPNGGTSTSSTTASANPSPALSPTQPLTPNQHLTAPRLVVVNPTPNPTPHPTPPATPILVAAPPPSFVASTLLPPAPTQTQALPVQLSLPQTSLHSSEYVRSQTEGGKLPLQLDIDARSCEGRESSGDSHMQILPVPEERSNNVLTKLPSPTESTHSSACPPVVNGRRVIQDAKDNGASRGAIGSVYRVISNERKGVGGLSVGGPGQMLTPSDQRFFLHQSSDERSSDSTSPSGSSGMFGNGRSRCLSSQSRENEAERTVMMQKGLDGNEKADEDRKQMQDRVSQVVSPRTGGAIKEGRKSMSTSSIGGRVKVKGFAKGKVREPVRLVAKPATIRRTTSSGPGVVAGTGMRRTLSTGTGVVRGGDTGLDGHAEGRKAGKQRAMFNIGSASASSEGRESRSVESASKAKNGAIPQHTVGKGPGRVVHAYAQPNANNVANYAPTQPPTHRTNPPQLPDPHHVAALGPEAAAAAVQPSRKKVVLTNTSSEDYESGTDSIGSEDGSWASEDLSDDELVVIAKDVNAVQKAAVTKTTTSNQPPPAAANKEKTPAQPPAQPAQPWPPQPQRSKSETYNNRQRNSKDEAALKLQAAAFEAQRQRDMFIKIPVPPKQNSIQRTRSGLLSQLMNPDPDIFPPNHPYRTSYSAVDLRRLGVPRVVSGPNGQGVLVGYTGAPLSNQLPPASATAVPQGPVPGTPKGLVTNKSSLALPLAAPVTTVAQLQPVNGSGSSGGYRPKGRPQGQELEDESDSSEENPDNTIQVSQSVVQQKLAALAGKRTAPPQQQQQAPPQRPPLVRALTAIESGQPAPPPHVAPAPIPLVHPYNLPPPAPPSTPRTTRRLMLQTEMSESLRRNLLWERQVSKMNVLGPRRRSSGMITGQNTAVRPGHLTATPSMVQLNNRIAESSGKVRGDRERERLGELEGKRDREERKQKGLARNRSWDDDYHYAGW